MMRLFPPGPRRFGQRGSPERVRREASFKDFRENSYR